MPVAGLAQINHMAYYSVFFARDLGSTANYIINFFYHRHGQQLTMIDTPHAVTVVVFT